METRLVLVIKKELYIFFSSQGPNAYQAFWFAEPRSDCGQMIDWNDKLLLGNVIYKPYGLNAQLQMPTK